MNPTCQRLCSIFATLVLVTPLFSATPQFSGTRLLISGDLIVEVGDPDDGSQRWNTGLRFSPVANVIQVTLGGRTFCYAPLNGGALGFDGGLPMEFDIGQEAFQPDPPGYNEGRNGDPFLKIGVGILRRNTAEYSFSGSYPVVELARTTSTWETDRAHFLQTLEGTANGYAYRLEVDLIVKNDGLAFHYVLANTGTRPFTTEQYLHNFLAPLHQPVGPNYRVTFPYKFGINPEIEFWQPPEFQRPPGPRGSPFLVDNNPPHNQLENIIQYTGIISSVPKVWITKPDGYQGRDLFALEQTRTGQRVVIDTTYPSAYVGIWSTNYNVAPEQFLILTLSSGEEISFTRRYQFSTDGSIAEDCTGNRIIDGADLAALSQAWLATPKSPNWNASCDISTTDDDVIDGFDLAALGSRWRHNSAEPIAVAQWALDETEGLVAHDPVGGSDGALLGFDAPGWVSGKVDGGLQFDGLDDAIAVENCPLPRAGLPRTVMVWIKTPAMPSARPIMAWGHGESGDYWLVEVDEENRLRLSTGAGFVSAGGVLVGDDAWHHIAVVLDPADPARPLISDVLLYVDGDRLPLHRMVEAEIDTSTRGALRIGAGPEGQSGFFAGILDEIALFDEVVGPTVIRQTAR